MRRTSLATARGLVVAVAAALAAPMTDAQEQASSARAVWPCGGRVDPAYLQIAEATGGHIQMSAPPDVAESAGEMLTALGDHPQTLFRLAGDLKPGVHEFRVPIESAVESVVFSISVQCFKVADIARPSGVPLAGGDGVTDLSSTTQRTVIVKRPEAGIWTVRTAGTGLAGIAIQAKSELGIEQVQFAAGGGAAFTREPLGNVENVVRIDITGRATDVRASLVNAASRRIALLPLTAGSYEGSFLSRVTIPAGGFRVMVEGKDATGAGFQRVHAPLFEAKP